MFRKNKPKHQIDFSNTTSVLFTAVAPILNLIPDAQLITTIQQRLNVVLDTYSEKRAENPNQYENIFKAGYSAQQKADAIRRFKLLLAGVANIMSNADVNALRNGDLGKALRAEVQEIAKDAGISHISSIHGMVEYVQYRHFNNGPYAKKVAQEAVQGFINVANTASKMMKQ